VVNLYVKIVINSSKLSRITKNKSIVLIVNKKLKDIRWNLILKNLAKLHLTEKVILKAFNLERHYELSLFMRVNLMKI